MEISAIGENKHLKYNHVVPIDLDTIPLDEREQALKEFSEGSLGLETCLSVMWDNNLKTNACCADEENELGIAYISMAEGVDVFSFISDDLLLNDMIALEDIYGSQTIRFAGSIEFREMLMLKLANDISMGKKKNTELVKQKINLPLNEEWMRERRIYSMRKAGISEEEIQFRERGIELNKILEFGTSDEIDEIMPEYVEYTRALMRRKIEKEEARKKYK